MKAPVRRRGEFLAQPPRVTPLLRAQRIQHAHENVRVQKALADYSTFRWKNTDFFILPTPGLTLGSITCWRVRRQEDGFFPAT
jgi:hypothetical protein